MWGLVRPYLKQVIVQTIVLTFSRAIIRGIWAIFLIQRGYGVVLYKPAWRITSVPRGL